MAFGSTSKPVSVDFFQEIVEVGWSNIDYIAFRVGFLRTASVIGAGAEACASPTETYATQADIPAGYAFEYISETQYKSIETTGAWIWQKIPAVSEEEDPTFEWATLSPSDLGIETEWNGGDDVVNNFSEWTVSGTGKAISSVEGNPVYIRFQPGTAGGANAEDIPHVPERPDDQFDEGAGSLKIETVAEPFTGETKCIRIETDSPGFYRKTWLYDDGNFESYANFDVGVPSQITYRGRTYNAYRRYLIPVSGSPEIPVSRAAILLYRKETSEA